MTNQEDESKPTKENYPWYKRDARAFYEATRGLSLEARGAFCDIIDLIYIHNGKVPDNPKWMSHALYVSVRKWKALRAELILASKIEIVDDTITNSRASLELEKRATQSCKVRETSVKHPRKVAENSKKPNEINKNSVSLARGRKELDIEEEEKREREEEKDINKIDRSILSLEDLVEEVWTASAGRMMDDHDDPGMLINSWLKAGAESVDIVETIKTVAANKPIESIEHFGYFKSSVLEAIEDRKAGKPNRHTPPVSPKEAFDRQVEEMMRQAKIDRLAGVQAHGSA